MSRVAGVWVTLFLIVLLVVIGTVEPQAQSPGTRAALIDRAQVWAPSDVAAIDFRRGPSGPGAFAPGSLIRCEHADAEMNGNSPKFACVLSGGASRAQRDALKLLAVLMQHTDSKPEQQRLMCLDKANSRRAPNANAHS